MKNLLFLEVKNCSKSVFFPCKNLLAGDDGSGKTTLMTKIQGAEHGKKGRGLEYLYLNIHDEDRDGKFILCAISTVIKWFHWCILGYTQVTCSRIALYLLGVVSVS